ncbi:MULTISPECIES: hypothetical protein [Methylobacterium]|uniref:hypothetical protein n=1 Tax=Methylobacterium TaxID=407 RepID=UPI00037CD8CE|nr:MULTISPECIES: hypothetical protein [Methylobacterium]MBN4094176.1 hypothetical protein [Methylobacterium sp. OT2]UIN33397.1 hypothetical protein LXM90_20185 [Methylobacterium oryzae]SEH48795.1 hypothetical protein SAMN02799636_02545 [Methylobacterium sp. 275MFSha3.1]SFS45986.1 hypothetical protein SAMN04487845_102269 [Methylobacterium sp. yr668]
MRAGSTQAGPIGGIRKRSRRDGAAIWVVLALTYMVFAGSVSLNEGMAAVGCASLGTLWWWGVGRRGGLRFRFDRASLHPLGPAVRDMPRQTARVGLHLLRAILGRAGGGATRERSAAEIAWATPEGDAAPAARAVGLLAASLAPDSYVLTLDRAHGTVVTHGLEEAR